jgi:Kef-type K+ transport system membrane component KefB
MAMSAAAINDVVAWVLLALAVAITNADSSPLVALWVLLLGLAFLAFMFLVVSPITYALAHYRERPPEPAVAMILVLVLGAAFLTDLIGIHVIFGAFICGLIIPKDGPFAGASTCPLLNIAIKVQASIESTAES